MANDHCYGTRLLEQMVVYRERCASDGRRKKNTAGRAVISCTGTGTNNIYKYIYKLHYAYKQSNLCTQIYHASTLVQSQYCQNNSRINLDNSCTNPPT